MVSALAVSLYYIILQVFITVKFSICLDIRMLKECKPAFVGNVVLVVGP